jgi:hypothetical protein
MYSAPSRLGCGYCFRRYMANLSMADINPWGRNAGCSFAMDKCVSNGVVSNPNFFCAAGTATQRAEQCASSLRSKGAEQLRRPKCASSHTSRVCVWRAATRVDAAPVAYRDQSRGRAGVCPRRLLRPQELHCRARASVSVLCKPNHRRLERPHGLLPTRPCARNQSFARAFGQLPSALRFKASLRAGGRMRCPRGGAALRRLVRARQQLPQVPTATAPARTLPMGLAPPMARHPPRRPPLA